MALHGLFLSARLSRKLECWWNLPFSRWFGFIGIRIYLVPLTKQINAGAWEAVISWGRLVFQCDLLLCVFIIHWLWVHQVNIPCILLSQAIWWNKQWSQALFRFQNLTAATIITALSWIPTMYGMFYMSLNIKYDKNPMGESIVFLLVPDDDQPQVNFPRLYSY